jgi:lysozyme family protein
MQADYKPFVDRLINRYEGGYGWNKKDPGGPTKYGITCYDLADHRHQTMNSMSAWAPAVRDMSLDEAEAIYQSKYAVAIRFDDLPAGIDVTMMDYGVNSGCARPVRVARALLSMGGGGMDSALLDKLHAIDAKQFINDMCDERLRFMHAIRNGSAWAEFGHGWESRVTDLRGYACGLAAGDPTPHAAPDLTHVVQPKAKHVPQTAGKTTAGGTVATGVAVHQLGFGWVPTAIAAAIIVVGGITYEIYQQTKADALNKVVHLT